MIHQDHLIISDNDSDDTLTHEAHHHHPAPPLVSLVPVHDAGVGGLLSEEEAHNLAILLMQRHSLSSGDTHRNVENWEPKVDGSEVLVFFHEEVGPIADVEVGNDEPELGEAEKEVRDVVDGEAALPQLARAGKQSVPVVVVVVGGLPLAHHLVQDHHAGQEEAHSQHGEGDNLNIIRPFNLKYEGSYVTCKDVGLSLDLQQVPSLKFMLSLQTRFSSI